MGGIVVGTSWIVFVLLLVGAISWHEQKAYRQGILTEWQLRKLEGALILAFLYLGMFPSFILIVMGIASLGKY